MKEREKGGRYLAKKPCECRKRSKSWILVLLVILIGAGFLLWQNGSAEAPELTESTGEPPENAASQSSAMDQEVTEEPVTSDTEPAETTLASTDADPLAVYKPIFDVYAQAVAEDWEIDQFEAHSISYMVMFLDNLDRLGYYLVDLNGDGTQELIISDGNVIYDLYANVNGEVIWVLSGAERSSWMLCNDNILKNNASGSAYSSEIDFYTWDGTQLVLQRNITFDGRLENPWSTTVEGNTQTISEQEATDLTQSYGMLHPPIEKLP